MSRDEMHAQAQARRDEALSAGAAGRLAEKLKPLPFPAERQAALRGRMMSRIAGETRTGISTLRANEGAWKTCLPGIETRTLHEAGGARTWLIRMAAGSRLPEHVHDEDEESLVLEGSCTLDGQLMQRGDFQLARRGSRHGEVYTEAGCVLLIRSTATNPPAARA